MKYRKIIIPLVLLAVVATYINVPFGTTTSVDSPPRTIDLWAEGRYEIPSSLWENGIVNVDTRITDTKEIEDGVRFNFEIDEEHRYFIIAVFHSAPGIAPILSINLSNGEYFSMNYSIEGGITHIIYSAEDWPIGTHHVDIGNGAAPNLNPLTHTGEAHIQIITAKNFEAVSDGIAPPTLDSILTIEAIEGDDMPDEVAFLIKNHSTHDILQNQNYFIEKLVDDSWVRVKSAENNHRDWIGSIQIYIAAGESYLFVKDLVALNDELAEMLHGTCRLIIPHMIWCWTNDNGVTLHQRIPLTVEFSQ